MKNSTYRKALTLLVKIRKFYLKIPPYDLSYIDDREERKDVESAMWLAIHYELKQLLDMSRAKELHGEQSVLRCLNPFCREELMVDGNDIFCPECGETYIIGHGGKLEVFTVSDDEENVTL